MMEKNCHSSAPNPTTTTATNNNNGDNSSAAAAATSTISDSGNSRAIQNTIRMLNKSSHKISKPNTKHQHHHHGPITTNIPIPATNTLQTNPTPSQPPPSSQAPPPLPQPPVYNINKNDFRDVVQKLTGFPVRHQTKPSSSEAMNPPPPPNKPTPNPSAAASAAATSSRLQKNRPPPLSHLGRSPPPLSQPDPTGVSAATNLAGSSAGGGGGGSMWAKAPMTTPFSPLPPFPTVSAAAESPITAYLRCLKGGNGGSGVLQQGVSIPSSPGSGGVPLFPLPTAPTAFGCVPSPRSGHQMMLPSSPKLPPIPSPK